MKYKILVTGAAGFIGGHLVSHLLKDGVNPRDIRLFIPKWDSLANLPEEKFEIVVGDIRNKDHCDIATKGVSCVYHLAAKTGSDGGEYRDFHATNVTGTKNLISSAVKARVTKFIFFSSIAVFGLPATAGKMENISESSPKAFSEGYGKTKLLGETALISAAKKTDLKYIIIRPSTVYGPRDSAGLAQLIKMLDKKLFFFIGNAKNKMDYVFVNRLVSAARFLEKSKIYNEDFIVGDSIPHTQYEIVNEICKNLGIATPKLFIPSLIALVLSGVYKYLCLIMGKKPIFFPNRVRVLSTPCYFNSGKLAKYFPDSANLSFETGIAKSVNWYEQHESKK